MYRNQMNFQVFEAKFLQIQLSTDIQLFFFFLISIKNCSGLKRLIEKLNSDYSDFNESHLEETEKWSCLLYL